MNPKPCNCDEKQSDKCRMCQEEEPCLYWCEQCNQAVADKRCPLCGLKARKMKSQ